MNIFTRWWEWMKIFLEILYSISPAIVKGSILTIDNQSGKNRSYRLRLWFSRRVAAIKFLAGFGSQSIA